jgi:predicted  nucleic acid-binding Zn-ribbon protein
VKNGFVFPSTGSKDGWNMSVTQGQTPIRTVKCSNPACGREIPLGRLFCPFCHYRVRPANEPVNGEPAAAQPEEAQRLQASLDTAQTENQRLRQELDSVHEELKKVSATSVRPDPSPGLIDEFHTKLKSAEERAAALESQSAQWEKKWKSAEEKAVSFEKQLAAKAVQIEPVISRRVKMIAGMVAVVTGLGGYGAGRYVQPNDNSQARVNQLLSQVAQAQQQIKDLKSSLASVNNNANQVKNDAKSQVDSMNQKISDLTNRLTASNTQRNLMDKNLSASKRDLASTQSQLNAAMEKQHSAETALTQQQAQLAASNQRVQQLEAHVKSLDEELAKARARPPNIANPNTSTLIWSGALTGKRRIDIKDGVASYGTIQSGALPGRPCRITTSNGNVQFKTVPGEKNHWNRVVFDVSGTGLVQVRINCVSE